MDVHSSKRACVERERCAAKRTSYFFIDSGDQLDDPLESDGWGQVKIKGRQAGEIIPIAREQPVQKG